MSYNTFGHLFRVTTWGESHGPAIGCVVDGCPPRRAIARKVVPQMVVRGALVQVGPHAIDRGNWDWNEVERNPFFSPDAKAAARWADFIDDVRKRGSSTGAVVEVIAEGVAAGLGAPV